MVTVTGLQSAELRIGVNNSLKTTSRGPGRAGQNQLTRPGPACREPCPAWTWPTEVTPPRSILLAAALSAPALLFGARSQRELLEMRDAGNPQPRHSASSSLPIPHRTGSLSFPGMTWAHSACLQHHSKHSLPRGLRWPPSSAPGHWKAICGAPTPRSGLGKEPRRGHSGRCRASAPRRLPVAPFVVMKKRDLHVLPTNDPNTSCRVRETLVVPCSLGKSLPLRRGHFLPRRKGSVRAPSTRLAWGWGFQSLG